MSWPLKQKTHALLAAEQGTIRKDWGGRVAVALVYPNTYAVGMSNLGFQTIYKHFNELPDVDSVRGNIDKVSHLVRVEAAR